MRAGQKKILIALLVLRVLAAPVALRPDLAETSTSDRFIVRVCVWPAQRPQGATTMSLLIRRTGRRNTDAIRGGVARCWQQSLASRSRPGLRYLSANGAPT